MVESLKLVHFGDIVEILKTISPQEWVIINTLITIIRIVVTTGATSATSERTFTSHKNIAKKLSLLAIGNDFEDNLLNRRNNLGNSSDSGFH